MSTTATADDLREEIAKKERDTELLQARGNVTRCMSRLGSTQDLSEGRQLFDAMGRQLDTLEAAAGEILNVNDEAGVLDDDVNLREYARAAELRQWSQEQRSAAGNLWGRLRSHARLVARVEAEQ